MKNTERIIRWLRSNPYLCSVNMKNKKNKYHLVAAFNRPQSILAERQLTGKWLYERLGKSENTVPSWCSNKEQPSLQNFVEMLKILDTDVRELIVSAKEPR